MQSPLRIAVRCDANETSGFGHFSRCLNFVRHFEKNTEITFIGNYNSFSLSSLNQYKIPHVFLKKEDAFNAEVLINYISPKNYSFIILDSYLYDQNYLNYLTCSPFKIIVIDDFCLLDFTNVDILINFCINADKNYNYNYNARSLFLGTSFFPYKPELILSQKMNPPQYFDNILIFIGGNDKFQIGEQVLQKLDLKLNKKNFILISSATNKKLLSNNNNTIQYLSPTFNIEAIYSRVDFVIHGGGMTKYECAFCFIPNATISQSELIAKDTVDFRIAGLTKDWGLATGFHKLEIASIFGETENDQSFKDNFANNAKKVFSTVGLNQIIQHIKEL
jgi:spore coat polysaccharide biosynthesis predicted glycosyltransferase SpsG